MRYCLQDLLTYWIQCRIHWLWILIATIRLWEIYPFSRYFHQAKHSTHCNFMAKMPCSYLQGSFSFNQVERVLNHLRSICFDREVSKQYPFDSNIYKCQPLQSEKCFDISSAEDAAFSAAFGVYDASPN